MSGGERQRAEITGKLIRTRGKIQKLGNVIDQAAGDVQCSTRKGITPEEKLAILEEIEAITTRATDEILAILDGKNIQKTVSGRARAIS